MSYARIYAKLRARDRAQAAVRANCAMPLSSVTELVRRLALGAGELGLRLAEDLHGIGSRWTRTRAPGWHGEGPEPDPLRLSSILDRAEQSLAENVLPFWARHAVDAERGGFITHIDRTGNRLGPTDKYLVMQARLIWTFAAAHRHGLTGQGYLEIAGQGFRFLTERMWDPEHGGFVWAVTRDGSVLDGRKSAYGQAFAIYALAAYGLTSGSPQALAWAERSFDLFADRAADGQLGFREEFGRDWVPVPGPAGEQKTLNTHLHLVEALMTLVEGSRREPHLAALRQLVDLILARAIHARHRYAWDEFDRAWRPRTVWRRRIRVSYGHGVELAWLLLDAMDCLGQPRQRVREGALGLIDHALAYGFDVSRGGLASYGPPLGAVRYAVYLPKARLIKHWWQQAEMLVATLEGYRETGRRGYLAAFEKQFDWIWHHQIDHEGGDWFESTTWREGKPLRLIKGHDWKDPYHNARALMEVTRRLRALGIAAP